MLAPSETIRAVAADGTVEGYASLFGEIDQARDMVLPGAFAASLRSRGVRRVPMLFQHDPAEPIGVWLDIREDTHGLYVRGRLIPEVERAKALLALLRAGTSDGLSIGFRTIKGRVDPKTRIRKLEAIDLWEISIVTFPLLPGARLALASAASGQREQHQKVRTVKAASLPAAPVRARSAWPVDPVVQRLKPERLYRKQPRFRFDTGERGLSWRDVTLPERALRARGM